MRSILRAAASWIQRGLPLRLLKIVAHSKTDSEVAYRQFVDIREDDEFASGGGPGCCGAVPEYQSSYDVFLSYCHEDGETAAILKQKLELIRPSVRIFFDRATLKPGASWLMQVAESLDNARRVAALYTPHYWNSPFCKDEFTAALARQNDTGEAVLFPIYLFSAKIPYLFRNFHYVDCREGDKTKLAQACSELAHGL